MVGNKYLLKTTIETYICLIFIPVFTPTFATYIVTIMPRQPQILSFLDLLVQGYDNSKGLPSETIANDEMRQGFRQFMANTAYVPMARDSTQYNNTYYVRKIVGLCLLPASPDNENAVKQAYEQLRIDTSQVSDSVKADLIRLITKACPIIPYTNFFKSVCNTELATPTPMLFAVQLRGVIAQQEGKNDLAGQFFDKLLLALRRHPQFAANIGPTAQLSAKAYFACYEKSGQQRHLVLALNRIKIANKKNSVTSEQFAHFHLMAAYSFLIHNEKTVAEPEKKTQYDQLYAIAEQNGASRSDLLVLKASYAYNTNNHNDVLSYSQQAFDAGLSDPVKKRRLRLQRIAAYDNLGNRPNEVVAEFAALGDIDAIPQITPEAKIALKIQYLGVLIDTGKPDNMALCKELSERIVDDYTANRRPPDALFESATAAIVACQGMLALKGAGLDVAVHHARSTPVTEDPNPVIRTLAIAAGGAYFSAATLGRDVTVLAVTPKSGSPSSNSGSRSL